MTSTAKLTGSGVNIWVERFGSVYAVMATGAKSGRIYQLSLHKTREGAERRLLEEEDMDKEWKYVVYEVLLDLSMRKIDEMHGGVVAVQEKYERVASIDSWVRCNHPQHGTFWDGFTPDSRHAIKISRVKA